MYIDLQSVGNVIMPLKLKTFYGYKFSDLKKLAIDICMYLYNIFM